MAAPPAAAPAGDGKVPCPQCSNPVPANFKFCGSCGFDMTKAPASAPAAAPAPSQGSGQLVLIRPDGTEGDRFPLSGTTTVGRDSSGPFAGDSYLSPQHAAFEFKSEGVVVTDLNSLNGVYIRIAHDVPTELTPGSIFRIGQEIIRFDLMPAPRRGADGAEIMGSANPGFLGRICLLIGRDTAGNCYPIPLTGLHLVRERGEVIFPDDGYVSGLHCRVHGEGGRMFLTDVGSSNGTFVRVRGTAVIPRGSLLLMGQQLFRVEY